MVLDVWWCRQGLTVTPHNRAPVVLRVVRRSKGKPTRITRWPTLVWPAPVVDRL